MKRQIPFPDPVPRFLCDEMLKRLARWLRAAGYDTAVLPDGSADAELLSLAEREQRHLLTRDRGLLARVRHAAGVHFVRHDSLDEQARELSDSESVDWLRAPFSRCLVCNSELLPATPEQAGRLPPGVLVDLLAYPQSSAVQAALTPDLRFCRHCDRLYWDGSHVRRMRQRLTAWHNGDFSTP